MTALPKPRPVAREPLSAPLAFLAGVMLGAGSMVLVVVLTVIERAA